MTLQDLIDELRMLPVSARTAQVELSNGDDIRSARYEQGVVVIECEDADDE